MPRRMKVEQLVENAQQYLEGNFEDLNDDEYIEAMSQMQSFCESCVEAKEEERARGTSEDDE